MLDNNQIQQYIAKFPDSFQHGMSQFALLIKMVSGLFRNQVLFVKGAKGNQVSIGKTKHRSRIVIKFDKRAKGNRVVIGNNFNGNVNILIKGSNSTLYIGDDAVIKKSKFSLLRDNALFAVGEHVGIRAGANIKSYGQLVLGDDAMLSANILIQEYDGHPIFDEQGNVLNHRISGVYVGPHVWLCRDVKIIKGVTIGKGSIIGAFSTLTKSVPSDAIAVGIPAKVVKEGGIYWARNHSEKELSKAKAFYAMD
ncbi:acyltransferase [Vibrio sp. 16]|uniref:acyltransferase n=1 Tax=Vibrio sp. 16 TaxID=391586 RepID=UPI002ACBFD8F|nr:acyltransferase [Vibrio sp. 16]CAK4070444.1 hypothetical protein VDT1_2461 [Vibrio sp. 16]